jgi:hypothetical protein
VDFKYVGEVSEQKIKETEKIFRKSDRIIYKSEDPSEADFFEWRKDGKRIAFGGKGGVIIYLTNETTYYVFSDNHMRRLSETFRKTITI